MVEKGRNATLLVITSGVVSCPCLLKGKQTVAWRGVAWRGVAHWRGVAWTGQDTVYSKKVETPKKSRFDQWILTIPQVKVLYWYIYISQT